MFALRPRSPSTINMFSAVLARAKSALQGSTATKSYSTSSFPEEDRELYRRGGYYPMVPGLLLNNRFTVQRKLGFGLHSTVWLAKDAQRPDTPVALKILTADRSQQPDLNEEVRWLNILGSKDPTHPGFAHVLGLLETFQVNSPNGAHLCLVTGVMGGSLEALLGRLPDGKVPLPLAKQIARQSIICS
jgi:serine/threonine-protein kinase SRPK3